MVVEPDGSVDGIGGIGGTDGMYSIDGGDRFGETRLQRKASAAYAGARASG
jgi:hypothetical protein